MYVSFDTNVACSRIIGTLSKLNGNCDVNVGHAKWILEMRLPNHITPAFCRCTFSGRICDGKTCLFTSQNEWHKTATQVWQLIACQQLVIAFMPRSKKYDPGYLTLGCRCRPGLLKVPNIRRWKSSEKSHKKGAV